MSINVGDKIPEFNLVNVDKNKLSDKDFLGSKTSFVFIPFPFSSVCDGEICQLRDHSLKSENGGIETVVITVCARPTNAAWADHYNLDYPILSDFWPHGEVSKKFGCFSEQAGISLRYTYITDEENIVTSITKSDEIPEPRNFDSYLSNLNS